MRREVGAGAVLWPLVSCLNMVFPLLPTDKDENLPLMSVSCRVRPTSLTMPIYRLGSGVIMVAVGAVSIYMAFRSPSPPFKKRQLATLFALQVRPDTVVLRVLKTFRLP